MRRIPLFLFLLLLLSEESVQRASGTEEDIFEKYRDQLGSCAASKRAKDYVRDVGAVSAAAAATAVGAAGLATPIGLFGLTMGLLVPTSTCYFDKLTEMLLEIMDAKIAQEHVDTLQAKLKGWNLTYANIVDDDDYRHQVKGINGDMTTDQFVFQKHEAFAAVLARDYLNARIAIMIELIDITGSEENKIEYKQQLLRVMLQFRKFIDRAIDAAISYKQDKIYEKKNHEFKRGCHLARTTEGGAVCKCGRRERSPGYCVHYVTYWRVPGDGRWFDSKELAEKAVDEQLRKYYSDVMKETMYNWKRIVMKITTDKGVCDQFNFGRRKRASQAMDCRECLAKFNEVKVFGLSVSLVNNRVKSDGKCGKRLIGYYPSWGDTEFTPQQASMLTHVVFAFFEMERDGTVKLGSADPTHTEDRKRDFEIANARLQHVLSMKTAAPHLKLMFAVGGWENSQYFSAVAGDSTVRMSFIKSLLSVVKKYGFDGVDLDWEYPVTGGAVEGTEADKANYVTLMEELRGVLDNHQKSSGRKSRYIISFAGAAGAWTLDPGYNLPQIFKYADWANAMTYDYFGPWSSQWGAYTGPPSPLYFAMPPRFSGKTNVDYTMKYYVCRTKEPNKVNLGVPFYGRYWENVREAFNESDQMWRRADPTFQWKFKGGYLPYNKIEKFIKEKGLKTHYHKKAETPWAYNPSNGYYLGYENSKSLDAKIKYAKQKNVGGMFIWAIDQDDGHNSLLSKLASADICSGDKASDVKYKCSPITEQRWWTWDVDKAKSGMCGRSAPTFKGYYPVCDPDDPGYHCCGKFGFCSTGPEFCDCPECIDYADDPNKILDKPIKPTRAIQWYTLDQAHAGRCGRGIPLLNGKIPICNPDDTRAHCCSNGNYCGTGEKFCECDGCVDFEKNPDYIYRPKQWWSFIDGADKSGKCGPEAPLMNGKVAICDPDSKSSYCCSKFGWCGSGRESCECKGCVNFKKKPDFVYRKKQWWSYTDGPNKAGKCGPNAPKYEGKVAICNPYSEKYHCCSKHGSCGTGPAFCDCDGCTDYR